MIEDPQVYELFLTPYQKNLLRKFKGIGARAELIAKFYLEMEYQKTSYEFIGSNPGADITIRVGSKEIDYEVKGTMDEDISLGKFKVSSSDSYRLLKSGITVIRVMKADTMSPLIAEMVYGVHFLLKREPRWRARK